MPNDETVSTLTVTLSDIPEQRRGKLLLCSIQQLRWTTESGCALLFTTPIYVQTIHEKHELQRDTRIIEEEVLLLLKGKNAPYLKKKIQEVVLPKLSAKSLDDDACRQELLSAESQELAA